jgi:hypothetical protein
MRATNTFRALCLGATLGLTGCISVHHDRPDYGGRYESYDSYDRYDVRHVYDAPVGVYVVSGLPHHYYHDGWYYRHTHGYWERCARPRGGHWSRVDHHYVPQRLHARYGGGGHGRHDRGDPRDWRRNDRDDHRDWKREQKQERKEDRWQRAEQRRDQRDDRREQKQEQRVERRQDRHERVEQRRDAKQERRAEKQERREERRDEKQERREENLARRAR